MFDAAKGALCYAPPSPETPRHGALMTYAPNDLGRPGLPDQAEEPSRRRSLGCAFEIVETLVLTIVIYLVIHNFVAQPFEVEQNSMIPTITPSEYVLIDKLSPRFGTYERGDIIVFQPPNAAGGGGVPFIKRVIALPGERVHLENGMVFVTPVGGNPVLLEEGYVARSAAGGPAPTQCRDLPVCTTEWTLPEGFYFVLGDNREQSSDSRAFGPVEEDLIVGRAWLRYFPLDRMGFMGRPDYPEFGTAAVADEAIAAIDVYLSGSSATIQASSSRP
jgi:signal peptidase I